LWLTAIREGFISLLPLTFFGVAALLLQQFLLQFLPGPMTAIFGNGWSSRLNFILDATHDVFGIALTTSVAIRLHTRLQPFSPKDTEPMPPQLVGISALINFLLFVVAKGPVSTASLGHESMLLAVLVGIGTAELLRLTRALTSVGSIRMPYDTEPYFYHSLRLCPAVILLGLIMLTVALSVETAAPSPAQHLLAPLAEWSLSHHGGDFVLYETAALINHLFWFIGIHGGYILDSYASDIFLPQGALYDGSLAWRPLYDIFVLFGGAGGTLGLLLAIFLSSTDGPQLRIAKLSLLPACFNINELLLFGLPCVLNPVYLIPFIGVPIALTALTIAATHFGIITVQPVMLHWTTPPFISGWMITGSWRGVALQVVELCVSTALYFPFVKQSEKRRLERQGLLMQNTHASILAEGQIRVSAIDRTDQVGMIARGLMSDLRQDLDRGALYLAYQPKHDRLGRMVGVEALLRWPHARYGDMPTQVAITLAEDSGDIHALGAWALEEACASKARWNMRGYRDLTMAINVSPLQLSDPDLAGRLAATLRKHGLDPSEIELEITESSMIPHTGTVEHTLERLEQTGVDLAMDDFGMGHSSLVLLRRFRVSTLKIDGSITRDVLTNSINANLINTIGSLGRAQDVDVVAEYVETEAQRQALAALGCTVFQGYFHSPALPEAECLAYMARHAARQDSVAQPIPLAGELAPAESA
jgi:lactose/cellobiose-specific phosphotransferase system IIC component